jgi:hypothetical protein
MPMYGILLRVHEQPDTIIEYDEQPARRVIEKATVDNNKQVTAII